MSVVSMTVRVGSDTGGTFTDLVGADGRIAKVLSTPDHPGRAVVDGLAELLGDQTPDVLCHGTTVGTNALLERRGATVALVTNQGFADLIEIARQDRPSLYDQEQDRPEPLVARHHRYEVSGRLAADGSELERCDPATLPVFADDVEAVAVTLLHADVEPAHEQLVAAAVAERGLDVTASHTVSPEFREYERTVTTVVNAYLRPACRAYLSELTDYADQVLVMTSAGGLVPAAEAAVPDRPARPAAAHRMILMWSRGARRVRAAKTLAPRPRLGADGATRTFKRRSIFARDRCCVSISRVRCWCRASSTAARTSPARAWWSTCPSKRGTTCCSRTIQSTAERRSAATSWSSTRC